MEAERSAQSALQALSGLHLPQLGICLLAAIDGDEKPLPYDVEPILAGLHP
jgi:hypothetical protein